MEPFRVLYVEDNEADQELTRRHLNRHAPHLKLRIVATVREAITTLEGGDVDLVLSDYRLPDGTGLDLVEAIKTRNWLVPVVLVTASGDTETAVRLLKAGAADYVVKRADYLDTLPAVLEGAFRWFGSIRELRQSVVRVLYAEHDPADVELTRRAFRDHGAQFELTVVPSTAEALRRLRTTPYDLFLLDYRMPDLSGLDLLKSLREERIHVPVVMLTGQGDEETAVQAFKLGVADYIIKREGYLARLPATAENVVAQRRLADEKDALLVLNGLTTAIGALRRIDQLADQVSRTAADVLKVDVAVLWLRNGTGFQPAGWFGAGAEAAASLAGSVEASALERMARDRRVHLNDLVRAEAPHPAVALMTQPDRTLAVSLVTGGEVTGILGVASRGPRVFSGTDERLLRILADHAAVAIENVRLYDQLNNRLEQLHRAQSQLIQTEKLAAMGQLLAGVAHELNNPLSVVLGQSVLLGEDLANSPLLGRATKISQAAERCARIVRNFLALARQQPPERAEVQLNRVVREAVELLAYPLRVDGVQLELDLADNLPPLWADPHQLHQVIVNLVSNAQQALHGVPPPRRLRLTSWYDHETRRVRLEVLDNGPGIPAAIRARIFEPFFTTKPPGQGTGLGLSLCQGIIESHGGTIRLESPEDGAGALFRIELPIDAPVRETRGHEPAPEPVRMRQGQVLVVDDEPEVAATAADMLARAGYRVETASDGRVALERLLARPFDLVIVDLKMPELDGPGLYRELERRAPHLLGRLIFLTGDALSQDLLDFVRRTGAASLQKPFTLAELQQLVTRVRP